MQEIQIPKQEFVATASLKVDGKNPNKMTKEQHERLKTSLIKWGWLVDIITNKDLLIADGEQRLIVAKELGMPQVGIRRLPVEEVDRRLLRQVLNKLRGEHELLLDAEEFEAIIDLGKKDDLKYLLDLSDGKLERYLNELHPPKDEDYEVPELDKVQTEIKHGDIIQLGKHRVMCGDSQSKEDIASLMDGKVANMLMTDPPYGVDYASKNAFLNERGKGNHVQTAYENDIPKDWHLFARAWLANIPLAEYNTVYIWINGYQLETLLNEAKAQGFNLHIPLIWVKNNAVLSRLDYLPKTEICLYGWKGKHHFYGQNKTTLLQFNKPLKNEWHPTMKPVEMIASLIPDGSKPDEIVLDIFGGSGTTLLACEQTHRICYSMELSEKYCEVIAQRWEKYTGQKRKLVKSCENNV